MSINHIFIFTDNPDQSADELLDFGFVEGSNRTHKGQGTSNRKFYFKNFYLELLYVSNIAEIQSDITNPSKLYERSQYKSNGYSPFGLCLDYDTKDDQLFKNSFKYKPNYLANDMYIEVLANENSPTLPWTFRWQSNIPSTLKTEPINNYTLSNTIFEVKDISNHFTKNISKHKDIDFIKSKNISLTLIFTEQKQTKRFETIPLIIKY